MNGHAQWDKLRWFSPNDKLDQWGDTHKIKRELLEQLDAFRSYLGVPIIVTSGYRDQPGSQHALGRAADIVCPYFKGSLFDLFLEASRFNFKGIGIYRDWKGHGATGGLHLDVRDAHHRAQWFCYKTPLGIKEYTELNVRILQEYGLI